LNSTPRHHPVVLVIDDNAADRYVLRMALHQSRVPGLTVLTDDGSTAIDRCRCSGIDPQFDVPEVIFLDLNLGLVSGFDVLKAIRANPCLDATVVVIVSGSEHLKDIAQCYRMNANAYMFKISDVNEMMKHVGTALTFWYRRRLTESDV
jgi:CheY-like chemotaxis protein